MEVSSIGFRNAPVTKFALLATSGLSLALQSWDAGGGRNLSPLLETFAYRHIGELAFGTYLFYNFRIFERQRGSESFGAQVVTVLTAQQLAHWIIRGLTDWSVRLGPHAVLASGFVSFFNDIPMMQDFKVAGIPITDKAIVYAAGVQLLASAGRATYPSFLAGALVGLAFQYNVFGCKRLRVPAIVTKVLGRTVGRLIGGSRSQERVYLPGGADHASSDSPQQALGEVSQEALEQLLSMGFEEAPARMALLRSQNDVQAALSRLL